MLYALHDGPWFILGHFFTVRRWEPKFVASTAQLAYSAIWARLPELPTEYYDIQLLKLVDNKLGHLLKIDDCTSSLTRGRYPRICIEIPLEKPLKTHVYIGNHKQLVMYEGLNCLCIRCGRFGHNSKACPFQTQNADVTSLPSSPPHHTTSSNTHSKLDNATENTWQTMQFPTKHRLRKSKAGPPLQRSLQSNNME